MDGRPIGEEAFNTFLSVEFYDHDTKTTEVVKGFKPNYATQFAFRNQIDDFYLSYLDWKLLKVEMFISKSGVAECIGVGYIVLQDLLKDKEGMKSQTIKSLIHIMSSKMPNVQIGIVRYSIRLWNPMVQTVRWYKEKSIATKEAEYSTWNVKIRIREIWNLTVPYGDIANVKPFCYYQFFDREDVFTESGRGQNAIIDSTKVFEIQFDEKLQHYLDRKDLIIHVIDDAAPVATD